ncbi:hypothetical protein [Spiroplasma culicicola]|uniref:Lipoprotein n=1 Tax=Spiroplasma culicicola AES-1 TaxID=1276246 RepID=W6A7B8_9MOLU|nr:hypothetical protein [Spiroplasma culicicola]AHI52876.1 hypothetical protein SCULI_v1c05350 [Spiroplasma culicicola AES-1]
MKKLLSILSILSLSSQPVALVAACEPIESFPSVSSSISIEDLNAKLFKHNRIEQVYFDNLEYVGKYFEHLNFESGLVTIKTTDPKISLNENMSEQELIFYSDLANIFKPISLSENEYDYTGLTFFIENIFIDDFSISRNEDQLEAHVETTMAVSVLKGWKMTGKMLLTVTQNQNSTGVVPFLFINTWLRSIYSDFNPILDDNGVFVLDEDFNQDLNNVKETILKKQSALKGLALTEEDIVIKENKTGFKILNQEYKIKENEIEK